MNTIIGTIRCTNPERVTEADLLDAADAIWDESDGDGQDRDSLAELLDLDRDHAAITERVLLAVNHS